MGRILLAGLALAALSQPLAAQALQSSPPALPTAADPDEIIVEALRIPRQALPTQVHWNYFTAVGARTAYERVTLFMRCALRSPDLSRLRSVVDGEPNSAPARFAQGFLIVTQPACPAEPLPEPSNFGSTTALSYGQSIINRGAIFDDVLRRYAPDAALTLNETQDPAVQARFNHREGLRNRLRLPNDREALVTIACLVREQPVLATRVVRATPGTLLERGLVQTMLVEGRGCLGGLKTVTVDPISMRVYIVDAFYRWVVAARNVDSLIPRDG